MCGDKARRFTAMIHKPSGADVQTLPSRCDKRAIHGVADTMGVLVTGNHFVSQGMVEESLGEFTQ